MSPLTLRRAFLPRNTRNTPAVHPPAAKAAARAQAQHPPAPNSPKEGPNLYGTPNRPFRVEPFKPGFEWETECECAKAFCRPPRHYKNDPPFYPWLPLTPLVNFNLNYKC
nr:MAG: hypothetical protein [Gammatorquevirus sp.]